MTAKKRGALSRETFLALPIAAQYIAAWQVLTGLGWDDVFSHLPLALDMTDDWSNFEVLMQSAYCRKEYPHLLTSQAQRVVADILCSPDYGPGALVDKAFWETMARWQIGDSDEQSLRWRALLRQALIYNQPDSDVVLADCLTHEPTTMLDDFCSCVADWRMTPALLGSYSTVVQGILLWVHLRGLYVSGIRLPKALGAWRAAFFALSVEEDLPPMLSYLLGQLAILILLIHPHVQFLRCRTIL